MQLKKNDWQGLRAGMLSSCALASIPFAVASHPLFIGHVGHYCPGSEPRYSQLFQFGTFSVPVTCRSDVHPFLWLMVATAGVSAMLPGTDCSITQKGNSASYYLMD